MRKAAHSTPSILNNGVVMDTYMYYLPYVFMSSLIGVGYCITQSGYWEKDPTHHWYNTTGDVIYTTDNRVLLIACASVCLENKECVMFGYNHITGTCRGFRFLEDNDMSILWESEVIYKHRQSCLRAGYYLLEDGPLCIKKHDGFLMWDDAQAQCKKDHGRLAVIDDIHKLEAFSKYSEKFAAGSVWVGVNDKAEEGSWIWLNGVRLNTTYWSSIELNDYDSGFKPNMKSADCGVLKNRSLYDNNCLGTSPYLCERADLV